MYVILTGQCCSKIEIYYKTKTKAFTKYWAFYGIYTRVNNENDHYVYRDTFANGFLGIWFCGTDWYIGQYSSRGNCLGFVNSDNNTNTCVHDIGFNWKYFDSPNWTDADESLSAKCLNEHGKLLLLNTLLDICELKLQQLHTHFQFLQIVNPFTRKCDQENYFKALYCILFVK